MSYLDDFFDSRKKLRANQAGKTDEDLKKDAEQVLVDQRQRFLNYKKFFGEEHGREVMFDLMNRFFVLSPLPDSGDALALARAEGKREVVLYLLKLANMDMNQLDKILKGEFV